MRKATLILLSGFAIVFLTSAVSPRSDQSSYADDRAQIEDLQARYMFALDFKDADTYASTFTEDGVLDYGPVVKGRDAIRTLIAGMGKTAADAAAKDTSGMRPIEGRHNISNITIKIDGNKAVGRAYWFHYYTTKNPSANEPGTNNPGTNSPRQTAGLDSFGHYEDEMVKVDGKWLFSKRKIYNELVDKWAYQGKNPAW